MEGFMNDGWNLDRQREERIPGVTAWAEVQGQRIIWHEKMDLAIPEGFCWRMINNKVGSVKQDQVLRTLEAYLDFMLQAVQRDISSLEKEKYNENSILLYQSGQNMKDTLGERD